MAEFKSFNIKPEEKNVFTSFNIKPLTIIDDDDVATPEYKQKDDTDTKRVEVPP